MSTSGAYTTAAGRPVVVFERSFSHPVERVWRAITEPAEMAHWFPSKVKADLRAGGAMEFTFAPDVALDGEVVELDEPHLFEFRWGADRLRFELSVEGEGTRLTMTHTLFEEGENAAAKTAAGWHLCLDALSARLDGARDPAPTGASPEWRERYDEYVAAGLPHGASIPH